MHVWSNADVFCIFHCVKRTLKTWPITLLISNTLGMTIYGLCRLATTSIIIYIMIRLSFRTEAICCTSSRAACLTHSLVWTGTQTHKVIIPQGRPTAQIQSHFPSCLLSDGDDAPLNWYFGVGFQGRAILSLPVNFAWTARKKKKIIIWWQACSTSQQICYRRWGDWNRVWFV